MIESIPAEVPGLAVALGCGLLVGIEREQHKDHDQLIPAGVRTCALLALAGAIATLLGPIALSVTGAFVGLAAIASYWRRGRDTPGLTTELVMVMVWLIGILAMQNAALAAGLAVVVTVLLQAKDWLHRFSRQVLSETELNDALLLLASALVILPILPETPLGIFEGLNLHRLWAIVVVLMTLNAAGYMAIRALGPQLGLPLTGLAGGLVSATATMASMGTRARELPALERSCAAGGMAANLATITMIAVILWALDRALLLALAPALVASLVLVLAWSAWLGWHALRTPVEGDGIPLATRPFHFGHALALAGLIAAALVVSTLLQRWLGDTGVKLTAVIVGLADAHAPVVSLGELTADGKVARSTAALAVLLALSSNALMKAIVSIGAGGAAYARFVLPGLLLMLAGAWGGWLLWPAAVPTP